MKKLIVNEYNTDIKKWMLRLLHEDDDRLEEEKDTHIIVHEVKKISKNKMLADNGYKADIYASNDGANKYCVFSDNSARELKYINLHSMEIKRTYAINLYGSQELFDERKWAQEICGYTRKQEAVRAAKYLLKTNNNFVIAKVQSNDREFIEIINKNVDSNVRPDFKRLFDFVDAITKTAQADAPVDYKKELNKIIGEAGKLKQEYRKYFL